MGMLKKILHYAGVHALSKILPLAGILIFSFFLLPEDVGYISLHLATIWILATVLSANMYSGIGRFLFDPNIKNADLLGTAVLTMVATALVVGLLWLLLIGPLERITQLPKLVLMLQIPIAIGLIAESTLTQYFIYKQNSQRLLAIIALKSLVLVLFAIFGVATRDTDKFLGVIYADAASAVFIMCAAAWVMAPNIRLKFSRTALKALANYSIPLIFYTISLAGLSQIDRVLIANFLDISQVGIYNVSYNLGMAALLIAIPVMNAFQARFFHNMNGGEPSKVAKDATTLLISFAIITALVACLVPFVAIHILPPQYHSGIRIVPIVALGSFAQIFFIIWARSLLFKNKTIINSAIVFLALTLNVALNLQFIPAYEIVGAAASTALAQLFMAVALQVVLMYLKMPHQSNDFKLTITLVIVFGWALLSMQFEFLYQIWIQLTFLVGLFTYFALFAASAIKGYRASGL